MKITLTKAQAKDLNLSNQLDFVRAAFYTGHSLGYIQEYAYSDAFERERNSVIRLALSLGMSDRDTVGVSE